MNPAPCICGEPVICPIHDHSSIAPWYVRMYPSDVQHEINRARAIGVWNESLQEASDYLLESRDDGDNE